MVFLYFCLLAFAAENASPTSSGGPLSPNQAAYDVKAVTLDLQVDPEKKAIRGTAKIQFKLLKKQENLELDLVPSLKVSVARINGEQTGVRHVKDKLMIGLPPSLEPGVHTVEIRYNGSPHEAKRPPWDGGFNWSKTDSGKPWVGVSSQGYGGKLWYPSKSHPSDKIEGLTLKITVPRPLYCAANGALEKITLAGGGRRTFVWKTDYPISTYNVSLNIAEFDIYNETLNHMRRELPLSFFFLKEHQKADKSETETYQQQKDRLIQLTKEYLRWYETKFGKYPFETFKLVHTAYLGMEHQTINSYGNHFKTEYDGFDYLLFHEMGHEWWGNKISVDDWSDFWIHEGIGTYATITYLEEMKGMDVARQWIDRISKQISNKQPIVPGKDRTSKEVYNLDVYYKGTRMLHALRWLITKEKVDALLHEFANTDQFTYNDFANSDDFIKLAEKHAGKKLDWFFDIYLRRAEPPTLSISRVERADKKGHTLTFEWDDPRFNVPLEVVTITDGVKTTRRIRFKEGKSSFRLYPGATYTVDPNEWVWKKVIPEKL